MCLLKGVHFTMLFFAPTRYQLRVLSAVASDFVVVWVAAAFATQDRIVLLANFFFGMVSLLIAMIIEKKLEYYDS